ncbi:DUF411 domain-containing protein [Chloroflexi bacterium TSY]|nr:DUF411 domain-containing protein [Chloroflexi bacterium TSY]
MSGCASAAIPAPDANVSTNPQSESVTEKAVQEEVIEEVVSTENVPVMTVYKSPTCGCCSKWVDHMRDAGFTVHTEDVSDLSAVKVEHGVLPQAQSCHTALVDGYVIEGHVPADAIHQLLAERPDVTGLAVPGMPIGSPGMEMEGYGVQPFDVLTFDDSGNTETFMSVTE